MQIKYDVVEIDFVSNDKTVIDTFETYSSAEDYALKKSKESSENYYYEIKESYHD